MWTRLIGATAFGTLSAVFGLQWYEAMSLFAIAYATGTLMGAKIGEELRGEKDA
jgi:hypothetical protein